MNSRALQAILKYLVTLLMLLAMAHRLLAQQTGPTPGVTFGGGRTIPREKRDTGPKPKIIEGSVEDANGNPIENAHVLVRDTKSKVTRTLTTDAKGVYSGTAFPSAADYEVTAEFRGEISEKKQVSSRLDREDNVLNFKMKASLGPAPNAASRTGTTEGTKIDTLDLVKLQVDLEYPVGAPAPFPAVMLLHGYGENRGVWSDFRKALLGRGYAVMTVDLRGHGDSKTKNNLPIAANPTWRNSPQEFPLDLDSAMTWLKTQTRINSNRIAIVGVDIGADLALIASGRYNQVRTVVAVNPNLTEGQQMAGGAVDYKPRSALIFASAEASGNSVKNNVQAPVQLRVMAQTGGTSAWFQNNQVSDGALQWLKDNF